MSVQCGRQFPAFFVSLRRKRGAGMRYSFLLSFEIKKFNAECTLTEIKPGLVLFFSTFVVLQIYHCSKFKQRNN